MNTGNAAKSAAKAPAASALLRACRHDEAGFDDFFEKLCRRREATGASAEAAAREILDAVRGQGDAALRAYTRRFDGAELSALEVSPEEWDAACAAVSAADLAALETAARRVRAFHERQAQAGFTFRDAAGALMGQRVHPLQRVGLYVPGGKASYPSTVIMNAVPARAAGVPEIIMTTPPDASGRIPNAVLAAARMAGVHRVFKLGGAQAVAALAYGSESVPRVDKIVGPGNAYVQAAKRLVFGTVDIDSEAGATEVLIVADESADPEYLAADLLSQAEHEEGASALLVAVDAELVRRVCTALARRLPGLSRERIARSALEQRGAALIARDIPHALALADAYAPEHLVLALRDAEAAHDRVKNAGTVFLGAHTPVAAGDYLAGPSHVLPTGGAARFFSPLGAGDFVKRTAFVRFEPETLRELGGDIIRLAEMEGLTAHGESVRRRLEKDAEEKKHG